MWRCSSRCIQVGKTIREDETDSENYMKRKRMVVRGTGKEEVAQENVQTQNRLNQSQLVQVNSEIEQTIEKQGMVCGYNIKLSSENKNKQEKGKADQTAESNSIFCVLMNFC